MNHNKRHTLAIRCALLLTLLGAGLALAAPPATAAMCMVDCWDEDGGWAGGGGLGGGNDTGSGAGGSDGGRVGSGGYEGYNPDTTAPSGTGWDDPRLPPHDGKDAGTEDAGTGGSGDAGTTTQAPDDDVDYKSCLINAEQRLTLCQYRGIAVCGLAAGGTGSAGPIAGTICGIAYDQVCRVQQSVDVSSCQETARCVASGSPLKDCENPWWRVRHGGYYTDPWPADPSESVCRNKPNLPACR